MNRTAVSPADTRARLLDEAALLFVRHGYEATSVRDITRAAGANLGAVTYHFGSKEALFLAAVEREIAPLQAVGEDVLRSTEPPERKLRLFLERLALHLLHKEPALHLLFMELARLRRQVPRMAVEAMRRRNQVFAAIVNEGIRQGVFRPCDVENAAWNFFGLLSGHIMMASGCVSGATRTRYSRAEALRIARQALDLFLHGLLAPGKGAA
jgi:AcrR family transcriptional regulator